MRFVAREGSDPHDETYRSRRSGRDRVRRCLRGRDGVGDSADDLTVDRVDTHYAVLHFTDDGDDSAHVSAQR